MRNYMSKNLKSSNALFLAIVIGCLSSFYLVQNKYLAIGIIVAPLLIAFATRFFSSKMNGLSLYVLFYMLFMAFTQLLVLRDFESLSFLFTVFSFFVFLMVYKNKDKKELIIISKCIIVFIIVIGIIDTIYRFNNPVSGPYYTGIHFFYKFKGKGLLYIDTNNTGMLMLSAICFYHYLKSKKIAISPFLYTLLLALLILTFSRACYIGYALFLFIFSKKIPTFLKIVGSLAAVLYLLLNVNVSGIDDISLQSKFAIYEKAANYFLDENIFKQLIGIGMGNSIEKFGIYTHSWLLTYSVEAGWVGFVLSFFMFALIVRESKETLKLIVPYLIAGLSFYPVFNPYFYCFLALVLCFESRALATSKEKVPSKANNFRRINGISTSY